MPFPYSYVTFTGDATIADFSYAGLDLIDNVPVKDQLKVYLDEQLQTSPSDYTLDLVQEEINFVTPPGNAVAIRIARETSLENKVVTFQNSSILTAVDMNKSFDQVWLLAQEQADRLENLTVQSVSGIPDNAVTAAKLNKTTGSEAVVTTAIRDGAVTTPKILDEAVTTDKLAAGAVTAAKIGTGEVVTAGIANLNVTEAKIADGAVTPAKLSTGGPSWNGSGTLTTTDLTVTGTGSVGGTMSFNSGYGSAAPAYGCRAWASYTQGSQSSLPFSRTAGSSTVTVTWANHPLTTGDIVGISGATNIVAGSYTVTVTGPSAFTFTTTATTAAGASNMTVTYIFIQSSGNVERIGVGEGTAQPVVAGEYLVKLNTAMPDGFYAILFGAVGNMNIQVKETSRTTGQFIVQHLAAGGANPAAIDSNKVSFFGVFR
jgi:hypothetical protein